MKTNAVSFTKTIKRKGKTRSPIVRYCSVTKVEYYANDTMVGSATASPYTYQWNNVLPGTHSLIAIVTNALGKTAISPAVNVTVTATTLQTYYIHTDHLDTPRVITDAAGNTVWEWQNTDPFGNNVPNENPSGLGAFTNNLGFPGQYRDKETNTFYNFYRDCYDPATGRYCQSDPIGLAGGINGYAYVRGNPISRVDPSGLFDSSVFIPTLVNNFTQTNNAIPGLLAPTGSGLATAGAVAAATGGMTAMQAINNIVSEYIFTPAAFRNGAAIDAITGAAVAVPVTAAKNFLLVGGVFEFGVAVGSAGVATWAMITAPTPSTPMQCSK
jgi:RHS repeat-associated protein